MKPFILLYKPQGMTPLAAIEQYRKHNPEYESVPLGVAGRLDPMANGLLLVLIGEENKKRHMYELLPKTYSMDILFGCTSDSYDLLGLVEHCKDAGFLSQGAVQDAVARLPSSFEQEYPIYSSKPVRGKPLYWWARKGKIHEIIIPKKQVNILQKTVLSWREISTPELLATLTQKIQTVIGDFRQENIISRWSDTLASRTNQIWPIATVSITCSSGTYMRGLAHTIGQTVKTGALAFSISRTQIGTHSIDESTLII